MDDLNRVIQHLESCLTKKRADIVLRDRESLIQGRGFREYATYLYKEHQRFAKHETRQRS
jgi:hypothetical protein